MLEHVLEILASLLAGLLLSGIGYGVNVRRELDALRLQAAQGSKDLEALTKSVHEMQQEQVNQGKQLSQIKGMLQSSGKPTESVS